MSSLLLKTAANSTTSALLEQLTQQAGCGDYTVLFFSLLAFTGYIGSGKFWNKPNPHLYKWYERPQEATGYSSSSKETRNIAQKLDEGGKDAVIFWGSQSGTAEGFAHRLARECRRRFKLDALVADLSDYDSESISLIPQTKFAIFIMSTYGEGDPSDNASDLWDWLRRSSTSLSNLKYAAFGLGNSNYKYYNKVIDVLVQKIDVGGAKSLLPVGKADDATSSTEEDFLEWKEHLFNMFQISLGLREHEQEYEPSLKVVEDSSLDLIDLHLGEPISQATNRKAASQTSPIGALPIKQIRELTTSPVSDRNVLHLEIDISEHPQIKYKTGDHLSIYPINPSTEASRLLGVLNLEAKKDTPLLISSLDPFNKKVKVPSTTTLAALFTSYLEICAPVSRETVQSLIPFAATESIKSTLRTISSDKTAYSDFLATNHTTLARLLEYTNSSLPSKIGQSPPTTTWSNLPLSFVLETLPPMTPRPYSISSSSITSPKQLSITASITSTSLASNPATKIQGLTTTHLTTLQRVPTPTLYASIRRSTFKPPPNPLTPILLLASGTGIAPLRAFIHERATLSRLSRPTGPILLIHGIRNLNSDALYASEFASLTSPTGPLHNLLTVVHAESRPSPATPRRYVQDTLLDPTIAAQVTDIISNDGGVFFCGSTAMAREAGKALLDVVARSTGKSEDEMLKWRDERRRVGRWREDVWG